MNHEHITPCGECCDGCAKHEGGLCRGCREADGRCEEWTGSGRCPVYACCEEHGAAFCGICGEFPCERLPQLLHWRPDCIRELREAAEAFRRSREARP